MAGFSTRLAGALAATAVMAAPVASQTPGQTQTQTLPT